MSYYQQKYLKYKEKYVDLKKQLGGQPYNINQIPVPHPLRVPKNNEIIILCLTVNQQIIDVYINNIILDFLKTDVTIPIRVAINNILGYSLRIRTYESLKYPNYLFFIIDIIYNGNVELSILLYMGKPISYTPNQDPLKHLFLKSYDPPSPPDGVNKELLTVANSVLTMLIQGGLQQDNEGIDLKVIDSMGRKHDIR
jgi:hypothetical protein